MRHCGATFLILRKWCNQMISRDLTARLRLSGAYFIKLHKFRDCARTIVSYVETWLRDWVAAVQLSLSCASCAQLRKMNDHLLKPGCATATLRRNFQQTALVARLRWINHMICWDLTAWLRCSSLIFMKLRKLRECPRSIISCENDQPLLCRAWLYSMGKLQSG